MSDDAPTGVLVMGHGTPDGPADIEPFYTSIRRGHPPTPRLLDQLVRRYEAIGGTSPLTRRTRAQVEGLGSVLEQEAPGEYLVRFGAKHVRPTIEQGLAELAEAGVGRVIGIVLTPHQSLMGSGEYLQRARIAAGGSTPPLPFVAVPAWHRSEGLAELLAERTVAALGSLDRAARARPAVFFTAHSLPVRAVADGDPYPEQVAESAADIVGLLTPAEREGATFTVAWQSAGRTPDPWIGPDLLSEIRRVADEGATAVVVCPVGFVSDHLEILYDLDIEASGAARSAGVAFARTASLNDDPRFLDVLARVVQQVAALPVPAATIESTPPA